MNLDLTQGYYTELANRTHDLIVEKAMNENLNKLLQDKDKEIERLKKLLDDNKIDYRGDEVSFSPVEKVTENVNKQDSNVKEND